MSASPEDLSITETRAWIERVVIGLKLCPFAPAPALKGAIRYATSEAETTEALLEDLAAESQRLVDAPPERIETTVLIHPQYQFAGTGFDDIGNETNRSPYPTLHLLREESVARAVDAFGDTRSISTVNLATLEKLGPEGLAAVKRGGPG